MYENAAGNTLLLKYEERAPRQIYKKEFLHSKFITIRIQPWFNSPTTKQKTNNQIFHESISFFPFHQGNSLTQSRCTHSKQAHNPAQTTSLNASLLQWCMNTQLKEHELKWRIKKHQGGPPFGLSVHREFLFIKTEVVKSDSILATEKVQYF